MTKDKSPLAAFPRRKYEPPDMPPIYEAKPLSFELSEDWLTIMAKEFDIEKAASDFAKAIAAKNSSEIESIGKQFFEKYGTNLMKRSLQLGEEYMDRTYEVIKAANDKTGGYLAWPLVPQRFIEAAVLGTQDALTMPIVQNNHDCFEFRIEECKMYAALKNKCNQGVADSIPCKHGCLAMIRTAFGDQDLMANTSMTATTPEKGYCEFTSFRI